MTRASALLLLAIFLLPLPAGAAQLPACASNAASCANDTTNAQGLVVATGDFNVGARIFNLWNTNCNSVYAEATTQAGHMYRVNMCLAITAGHIPNATLVTMVLGINSNVDTEILACQGPPSNNYQPAGGCMVDVDVNQAIATALAVTETTASTTATGATGSGTLTVASATGIVRGQSVYAAGVAPGATVAYVTGTTVYLSIPTTAALSSTPIAFVLDTGLPTRQW